MSKGGEHILLVDDEAHVVHVLGRALEAEGYLLSACLNGQEALEAVRREPPALIITDLSMPGMSGVELAMELHRYGETATIPLVLITGRGHTIEPEALRHTNIRRVCSKPFSARAIVKLVGLTLGESGNGPAASQGARQAGA